MAAGGGGAWKVAYADFVTAMMAFFMVMWITAQDKPVREAIAGYFQDPLGTSSEHSRPTSLLPSELHGDTPGLDMPKTKPPGNQPGPDVSNGAETDLQTNTPWTHPHRVHFLQETDRTWPAVVLLFPEASAELDEHAQEQLRRLIPQLTGKLNRIEIRAHSTRRPLPSDSPFPDHWQLCYGRSMATMQYLVDNGIEPDRIRLSQSGGYEPQTQYIGSKWQRENSRVELFLLNEFVEELPGTPSAEPAAEKQQAAENQ